MPRAWWSPLSTSKSSATRREMDFVRIGWDAERVALRKHVAHGLYPEYADFGPELRWVRRGRLKFVAIAEIEDWLRRSAALTLDRLDEPCRGRRDPGLRLTLRAPIRLGRSEREVASQMDDRDTRVQRAVVASD
jgi:hypothetical protein